MTMPQNLDSPGSTPAYLLSACREVERQLTLLHPQFIWTATVKPKAKPA